MEVEAEASLVDVNPTVIGGQLHVRGWAFKSGAYTNTVTSGITTPVKLIRSAPYSVLSPTTLGDSDSGTYTEWQPLLQTSGSTLWDDTTNGWGEILGDSNTVYFPTRGNAGTGDTVNVVSYTTAGTVLTQNIQFNFTAGTNVMMYGTPVMHGVTVDEEVAWDEKPRRNHRGETARSFHKDKQFAKVHPNEIIALQLLRKMISHEDFRHYLRHGFVSVRGASGFIYQVCRTNNIQVWDRNEKIASLCVHLKIDGKSAPPTDHVVGKMLIIECDEAEIWKRSNINWAEGQRHQRPQLTALGVEVKPEPDLNLYGNGEILGAFNLNANGGLGDLVWRLAQNA